LLGFDQRAEPAQLPVAYLLNDCFAIRQE